jgi:hypothetical protein
METVVRQWRSDSVGARFENIQAKIRVHRQIPDAVIFVADLDLRHQLQIIDPAAYGELWADEELRKIFMEKQIQKTIWPLFRQHIHDGMSRLGMSPVTLPWIL